MAGDPGIEQLNELDGDAFVEALAPLFEGAPRFLRRLAGARPFATEEELFDAARTTARGMPTEDQIELLDAHPRIGADPATVSELSHAEQGFDEPEGDDQTWVGEELSALNDAYESRFGFRFVVFVAGRPRSDIIPILERALHADREEELRRGLDDAILIAADRRRSLRGPQPLREELREAVTLEVSRFMVGEIDRDGLVRATHRLIEEGIESPSLLALGLVDSDRESDLGESLRGLLAEIGLADWDAGQAAQLLALHAAASIVGELSQPIDGARRIATVSDNKVFAELVARWEADVELRDEVDAEIRHEAVELFGRPDAAEDAPA
ncbi:MAG TPA: 2-oxo-4-hydroxy-4-carboxy-5-ureidoimidazoline decarboxylase [Methylomirabilota bacterium]|nr:2-oxo-4-hydroxy-4-carboxy-5-ureidoimidazoline decarboxylase [Methylomirabilota bacterium]